MSQLLELLYDDDDTAISSDIFADLDIVSPIPITDITTIIENIGHTIVTNTDHHVTAIANKYADIGHIISIFDRLMMPNVINDLIYSRCTPSTSTKLQIINHTLSNDNIIGAYAASYHVVFNNIIHHIIHWLSAAIAKGMHIKKMIFDKYELSYDDAKPYATIKNIEIREYNTNMQYSLCSIAKNLCTLIASHRTCTITNELLYLCTAIKDLDISNNPNVTTCAPFAKSLRKLKAFNSSRLNDIGLEQCTVIEELNIAMTNVSTCAPFAKTLKILHANHLMCKLGDNGLKSCTAIEELYADHNMHITSCAPFALTLRVLSAIGDTCGISDNGLRTCHKICILNASHNTLITTCISFSRTLHTLSAIKCKISDRGLRACFILRELVADDNYRITTCCPFSHSLQTLSACGSCGISDKGLIKCKHIKYLDADSNTKITTCEPFAKSLTTLFASYSCGISDQGLLLCTSITSLESHYNCKITMLLPAATNKKMKK